MKSLLELSVWELAHFVLIIFKDNDVYLTVSNSDNYACFADAAFIEDTRCPNQ